MDTKAILKEHVTDMSPELQRLKKVDILINDNGDSMSDLHEREITAISLFKALDEHIIKIPASIAFMDHFISLRRSRDRLGRQEWVNILKSRPSYTVNPYYDEPGADSGGANKPGLIPRLWGFLFKRNKPSGGDR